MSVASTADRWAAGDAYETFMGRWSRRLACDFVRWLGAKPRLNWLDVGCGTGALTSAICDLADPASIVACDPSPPFVEDVRRRIPDARITAIVAGCGDLPEHAGGFDRVVSGLVLNFLPDQRGSVEEMRSRTHPGGIVSAYVWDYSGGMQFLRVFWDEVVALDDGARRIDEGVRFPLCRPDALESIFTDAGLRDVTSGSIVVPTRFETFDDYWRPFLGKTGPAPSYVTSLSDEHRAELEARLERRLAPAGRDSAIELTARAWAVRGTVG
jgi:SAM-dependent methyltransferase